MRLNFKPVVESIWTKCETEVDESVWNLDNTHPTNISPLDIAWNEIWVDVWNSTWSTIMRVLFDAFEEAL